MISTLLLLFVLQISPTKAQPSAPDSIAILKTSKGDIRLKLFRDRAPATVDNFIGLAKGTKDWKDVATGKQQRDRPFYRDLIFHRIHPDLGIVTGDPWGSGHGWPGYTISREEQPDMRFDRPYLVGLSMIPGKPNSGGSQFFITTKAQPDFDGKYPIFAEVISGFDVVKQISRERRDAMMKPIKDIILKDVIIE